MSRKKDDIIRIDEVWLGEKRFTSCDLLDIRPVEFDIEIRASNGGSKKEAPPLGPKGAKAAQDLMNRLEDRVTALADKLVDMAVEKKAEEESSESSKPYRELEAEVGKVNKTIERYVEEIRVELRRAVAKAVGLDPRELETDGSESFTPIRIPIGVFSFEEGGEEEGEYIDSEQLLKTLRSTKGWLYCGAALNGVKAYILVSRKKPVRVPDLKLLQKAVGGSARPIQGICRLDGNNLVCRFTEDATKVPQRVHLRDGVAEQTEKKFAITLIKERLKEMPKPSDLHKLDDEGNAREK